MSGALVVLGGTSGIGLRLAASYAPRGPAGGVTGRDPERAAAAAAGIDGSAAVSSLALDLAEPDQIAGRLESLGAVRRLVLGAIERDENSVAAYDVARALRLVTLKLVGYTEVVHALA